MGTIHEFKDDYNIGLLGENLIKDYYNSRYTSEGKEIYIVRPAEKWEQEQGADFFVVNNKLGTKYFEVKTDTQSKDTGNVALEIQIVYGDTKSIGCALKTFPDYLFYWIYPTTKVLYWNPKELNPYIVDWLLDNPKIVETKNKNFFSRSLLVSVEKLKQTSVVRSFEVPLEIVEKNK
tara:strand:- start:1058 stop:1588 length:531 start_codon:yes stop_codon:yes gene_type:complete